jgi:hypothetical protein
LTPSFQKKYCQWVFRGYEQDAPNDATLRLATIAGQKAKGIQLVAMVKTGKPLAASSRMLASVAASFGRGSRLRQARTAAKGYSLAS